MVDDIKPHIIGITESWANNDITDAEFGAQHVLEPTRAARVLYIVLSSQKEFVDNVVIQESLVAAIITNCILT